MSIDLSPFGQLIFDGETQNTLSKMESPIRHLLPRLPEAIIDVAPEMKDRFLKEFPRLSFSINIVDDARSFSKCNPVTKEIIVSRGLAEFCWSAAYSYPLLYDFIAPKCGVDKPRTLDLTSNGVTRTAIDLLNWSIGCATEEKATSWPENLPRPDYLREFSDRDDLIHVAQEFCLVSLTSIVLHELGHLELSHEYTDDYALSIEQEKDADRFAFDWILGAPSISKKCFGKRSIAIAISLLAFASKDIYRPTKEPIDHPDWFNRFYYFAESYFHDKPNNIVWGIAVVFLKLHMNSVNLPASPEMTGTFRDKVNEYLNTLSNT